MSGAGNRHFTPIFPGITEVMRTMGPGVNLDFLRLLKWATIGSTIHLVSNCEDVTDWDISNSSVFNAVDETTDKMEDSASMELVDVGSTKGDFVTLDAAHAPNGEDWTEFNFLCMWVHDDTGLRLAGELTFQIKNGNDWSDEIAVPVNSNADVFELKTIDISAVAKNNVTGFRFVNQRGSGGSEKVYIDQIFVTDLVTGLGSGNVMCSGPVQGPVIPMLMATGSITPGMPVSGGALGVSQAAENAENCIGVACAYENADEAITAADGAPKEILVAQQGARIIARADSTGAAVGDKMGIDTSALSLDEMTTTCEQGCFIALGTPTANWDFLAVIQKQGADN